MYGLMIYERATSVPVSRLTPEQIDAVRTALGNQQPPPR
ncbi:hypothetical protein PWR05_35245 [Paraburkholderia sp. A2RI-6]